MDRTAVPPVRAAVHRPSRDRRDLAAGGTALGPRGRQWLLLTHPYHDLLWANARVVPTWGLAGLAYEPTAVLYVPMVFGLVAAGVGVLLLVETVVNYGRLYQSEATAVALSTVPPSVGFVAWLLGLGPVPCSTSPRHCSCSTSSSTPTRSSGATCS
ncbi:histidine kinase N-terminal 7TM domain-containing protein [Halomicroarcula sp. GCM10025710]